MDLLGRLLRKGKRLDLEEAAVGVEEAAEALPLVLPLLVTLLLP